MEEIHDGIEDHGEARIGMVQMVIAFHLAAGITFPSENLENL